MSDSQQVYDKLWEDLWGDIQAHGPVHRHTRADLIRAINGLEVASILEVGCGSGENLAALARTGRYRLAGADVSPKALEAARRRLPEIPLHQLDIENAILPDRFDLVMGIQMLEHLLDDIAALKNMAAMSGSYVLVSSMKGRMRRSELRIGHVRNYSSVELKAKIERAGLRVVRMWGWGFPFYSPVVRSLVECLPGGVPLGPMSRVNRAIAEALYHLYRFNWPGRGDVITALAIKDSNEVR